MRTLVLAIVLAVALSGCFSKGPSQGQLEAQASKAIEAFRDDVGVHGRLAGIHVTGWVRVETEQGGFPITVQLNPDVDVALGPAGEVLIGGKLADMEFTGYCDPDRIVSITKNTQRYGMQDVSIEARNPVGYCTGEGSEALLTPFFEFELIDPAILTGNLHVEDLDPQRFGKSGKSVEAEYTTSGPAGTTELFFEIRGDKVMQIVAENPESKIVMDMTYAQREAPQAPTADRRLPSPVSGIQSTDEDGWHWTGHTREGAAIAEYRLQVYGDGTSFSCSGATSDPLVTFDLADGHEQSRDGWQLLVLDDSDGLLGKGDEIHIRQPSSAVQAFDYEVRFVDDWAQATAQPSCAIPSAPAALLAVGFVVLAWVGRRQGL